MRFIVNTNRRADRKLGEEDVTLSEHEMFYGTKEAASEVVTLSAGPLSVEIEGGAVRYVRFQGHEAIRGIDYLIRDDSWRTLPARSMVVGREESDNGFALQLDVEAGVGQPQFVYRLSIKGDSDGRLEVFADGEAVTDLVTNRTGFVVLHPVVGVSGRPVTVTHKDGSTSETVFPELISPGQPIFDIRALRHQVTEGLHATCTMEAALPQDAETIFEMEDQRNWTDASYKTYVGSLLDPWPYEIKAGTRVTQRILVEFDGAVTSTETMAAGGGIAIELGDTPAGVMPEIGLGLMPGHRSVLLNEEYPGNRLRPQFITCYVESDQPDLSNVLGDYATVAATLGASVQLELVLPKGPSTRGELDRVANACREAGIFPKRVIACPAPYLKSVQPSGPWPEVIDLGHVYNQTREAFPESRVLGGMLSYFTELNRKRPPIDTVDALTCTTSPIVHAADDRSVMETLESVPAVIASMKAMADGRPLHLGPSGIAMRHNPYGEATAPNPDGVRIAMAEDDPRQRGLFAAAWAVGYAAAVAEAGVETLAINHLCGPLGVGKADGLVYPVFHVMAALTEAGGQELIPVRIAGNAASVAWRDSGGVRLLAANLSAEPLAIDLSGGVKGTILDTGSFDAASLNPSWRGNEASLGERVELGPYAVLFGRV